MSEIISKILWFSAFLLTGCSSPIQDYRGKAPTLSFNIFLVRN